MDDDRRRRLEEALRKLEDGAAEEALALLDALGPDGDAAGRGIRLHLRLQALRLLDRVMLPRNQATD